MPDRDEADYVLDASAVAKIFLAEPESVAFRDWYVGEVARGATFSAPGLLAYEVAQLLARNLRPPSGADASAWLAERHAEALDGIELDHDAARASFPWMARLSAYDASYLAVAARERACLVSYDDVLLKEAARAGVETVRPE